MLHAMKGARTMAAHQPAWGNIFVVPSTMTGDDLLRLPDDGSKNELYEGMLVREELTAAGHGHLCQRLGGELYTYAKATGYPHPIVQNTLFDLTSPGALRRTVLAPDLAIMRTTGPFPWARFRSIRRCWPPRSFRHHKPWLNCACKPAFIAARALMRSG
jgi:hypothetical protein